MSGIVNISKLRLLVQYKAVFLRLAKLMFTTKDSSIYVVPYAPAGHYFFGSNEFQEQQIEVTVPFKTQLSSTLKQLPHLSIHEKGQVHVYIGKSRAGPLKIPALSEWQGQHIATLLVDKFDGLATFNGTPQSTKSEQDFVFQIEEPLESGRLAFYVNGVQPLFGDDCPVVVTLKRPSLPNPVYIGVRPWPQAPLGATSGKTGVTVLAGWDPVTAVTPAKTQFLFIRGE